MKQMRICAIYTKHFYPVRFNAESKDMVMYNEHKFEFVPSGRRGVQTLAYSLLDGHMSYPTTVFLTELEERIMIRPGYKGPKAFLSELKYVVNEAYKEGVNIDDFVQSAQ